MYIISLFYYYYYTQIRANSPCSHALMPQMIAKLEEAKKKSREDFKKVTELSTELQEERQLAATSKLVKEKKAEEDYKRIMELGRLLQKEREKLLTAEQGLQEEKAKNSHTPQTQTVEHLALPSGDSSKSPKTRGRSKTLSTPKKIVMAPAPAVVVAPVAVNQDALRMRAQLLEYRKLQQEQSAIEARLSCKLPPSLSLSLSLCQVFSMRVVSSFKKKKIS